MLRPKCLFVIKGLRKEGHGQKDVDLLFKSIVLSKLTYGLSIYGASNADLFVMDCFLKRRPKKRYISDKLGINFMMFSNNLTESSMIKLARTNTIRYILSYRL